jgi:uncharacterized LabA/DUF88 family protein
MENNIAFIDGQNLHLWLQSEGRWIDNKKFRIFLKDQFHVQEAYYFLGFVSEEQQDLYHSLQKAGFIVSFREHSSALKWKKKWNVDVDIVFEIMKKIIEKEEFNQIVLVSGDGDYIKLVDYLIKKSLFKRVLFPNKNHSSLYKKIGNKYYFYLKDAKEKLEFKKRGS